jgi:hypothetical protein
MYRLLIHQRSPARFGARGRCSGITSEKQSNQRQGNRGKRNDGHNPFTVFCKPLHAITAGGAGSLYEDAVLTMGIASTLHVRATALGMKGNLVLLEFDEWQDRSSFELSRL